jgi:hypothetical protein
MQRAFDDATNRLAQRLEAETLAPPSPLRRPSRLMLTGTPAPGRLEAAAADRNLDEARAKCGTAWTNRLAALLPDGWRLGPCVGVGDGERFEPPCFDRLECTSICGINKQGGGMHSLAGISALTNSTRTNSTLSFLVENEDEGRTFLGGKDPNFGEDHFALGPGEHFMLFRYSKYVLHFETTAGRSRTSGMEREGDRIIEAPPGLVIRSFYGRARRDSDGLHVGTYCLGLVYGPPTAVWRPGTPVRFSDAATARARAVLALADDGEGPIGRLPEVLVHLVLAFAIDLFPACRVVQGPWGLRHELADDGIVPAVAAVPG